MNKVYNKEFLSYLVKVMKEKGFKAMAEESKKRWEKAKAMGIVTALFFFVALPVKAETYILRYTLITSSTKHLSSARSDGNAGESKKTLRPDTKEKTAGVPKLTEMDYILSKPHGSTLLKIFKKESGMGQHDECRRRGIGYNGIGLGESDEYIRLHGPNCFPTYEALWDRAERLLVELGADKDIATALCTWNLGIRQPNCLYYQSLINL